ncbi:MAG: transcriptional regulator [Parabacteroides sp.]|nr:transcriptional regulator [Parabacteroides sp.]
MGKNEVTVSRWCPKASQPSLEMLIEIAAILQIAASQLINKGME